MEQYKSQVFVDGQVLTADEMNNIISGVDEALSSIEHFDNTIVPEVDNLMQQMTSLNHDINQLNTRVPITPSQEGQYFLSSIVEGDHKIYDWINSPISPSPGSSSLVFLDPQEDGNIYIYDQGNSGDITEE